MDWITLTIELIGLVIMLMWIVIPIQEFKLILRQIRERERREADRRLQSPRPGDSQ